MTHKNKLVRVNIPDNIIKLKQRTVVKYQELLSYALHVAATDSFNKLEQYIKDIEEQRENRTYKTKRNYAKQFISYRKYYDKNKRAISAKNARRQKQKRQQLKNGDHK